MRFLSFLLSGTLLLSLAACATQPLESNRLKPAAPVNALTSRMALRILREHGAEKRIGVVVLNPDGTPIQSVRSWVRYDAERLEMQDLTIEDGRFVLFAPGERTIDASQGLLKLGAAVREPLRDREVLVASFTVRRKGKGTDAPNILTFYDWRAEGEGHTAVLSVRGGTAMNTLRAPASLAL